jgi:hypothetical protein
MKNIRPKHTHIIKQNRGKYLELSMETHIKKTRQNTPTQSNIRKQTTIQETEE